MIFSRTGNTTVITQETASIVDLVANIEKKYDGLVNDNIIVNLFSVKDFTPTDINDFLLISKKHKENKRSFVIVSSRITYDETPEDLSLVPTLKEAHDLIEMEEIERDLGI